MEKKFKYIFSLRLAGYLMMKKHRDSEMLVLPEESEEEEE